MKSQDLPGVPSTSFTERAGVNAVASIVNDARCIWRETPLRDVGIDGQVEYVTPSGGATVNTKCPAVRHSVPRGG
jgi:hypothetical protein